jgi:diguanylate cyclase (GGDEF)-like protein
MLDSGVRLRTARTIASAALGITLLICLPWFGWVPLACFALSSAQVLTLDSRIARSKRPERVVAVSLAFTALTIAAGIPFTGGAQSPLMTWLALPAALMSSRFRRAVVVVGVAWSLLLLAVLAVAVDVAGFLSDPTTVLVSTALIVGVTVCSLALSESEIQHREESRFDHLTGLLNRNALAARFGELESQGLSAHETVSVVLYDVDHFKRVNDDHGHDRGDAVLRDIADILRTDSRGFDLVYRLGGEEFAVVMPGVDRDAALLVAERQRIAIAASLPGGLNVTISAGVSARRGEAIAWEALYLGADAALLQAKRNGRDRVVLDDQVLAPA